MAEPEPELEPQQQPMTVMDQSTEVISGPRQHALDIPCVTVLGLPDSESPMTIRELG